MADLAWAGMQRLTPRPAGRGMAHPQASPDATCWGIEAAQVLLVLVSANHDHQRDGVPEWDHLLQTGFEDNPLFDVWSWRKASMFRRLHLNLLHAHHEAVCLIRIADDRKSEEGYTPQCG
jgi:hypothetical protein